jgi:hypothetical protein
MEKKDSELSAEEYAERKRRERLEQNRVSAMESRKRKKTMIEELQRSVIHLSKENKDLNERNDTLRRDLVELGSKVCAAPFLFQRAYWSRTKHISKFAFFFIFIWHTFTFFFSDNIFLSFQYPQVLPLHTVMGIGFQVPENLNPGGYNPSAASVSHLASTPATSSMPPAPSSAPNPSDPSFQMNPALLAAFISQQQGSAQMMNNPSSANQSEQNGSSGKDEHSNVRKDGDHTSFNEQKK